jgi:hypothetical protein
MAEKRPKSRKARGLLALAKALKQKEKENGTRINVITSKDLHYSDPIGPDIDQPEGLRKFAQKKVDELGLDSSKIVRGRDIEGKEGLPLLLFHRSYGDPFKKFNLVENLNKGTKSNYNFISTGLNLKPFKEGGQWVKAKEYNYPNIKVMGEVGPGARVLVGVGKVNKIFDYDNPKQVNEVINVLRKKRRKQIAKNKKDAGYTFNQEDKDQLENSLRVQREQISYGNYSDIENEQVLDVLQELGYDSFTTFEGGKNVMLLKPNEQFIPLFDPLKTSTVGFAKGGRVERNPYDYEPRGI